jgi:DNA-binding MarR family transcriptional regulator
MVDLGDQTLRAGLRGLAAQLVAEMDRRYDYYLEGTPYEHVRPFDVRVFVAVVKQELSVSDIARRFAVSRQAVHASVGRLIEMNYVECHPMPGNGRDKRIVVTERGQQASVVASRNIASVEGECTAIIGAENLAMLRRQLALIAEGLQLRQIQATGVKSSKS